MAIGRLKLKPLPENLGWNKPVPEAASLRSVRVPPLPPIVLLLKFISTVAAVLVVVMVLLAVTSIGLATGAVLGVRLADMVSVPPDKCSVPAPLPSVLVPLRMIWLALRVVSPLSVLAQLIVSRAVPC